jgi:hypothetical protein
MPALSSRADEESAINHEHKDPLTSASFNLDFPRTAAQAILDNMVNLERLAKDLEPLGSCHFEAGYDIIPEHHKSLIPEDTGYFMGNMT